MSHFKILGRLYPPSDAHAPKTSYDKKAEEDNKNIFTNKHIMIFDNNSYGYLFLLFWSLNQTRSP